MKHKYTKYIQLDTHKCKACLKCLKGCPDKVIGKVDLPWHKHAKIVKPENCSGCMNCISACKFGAYSTFDSQKLKAKKKRVHTFNSFLVNNLLFIIGISVIISGLVLQFEYHMGGHTIQQHGNTFDTSGFVQNYEQMREINTNKIVWGFKYGNWSDIHKVLIVCFSLLMIYHTYQHWKWYKGIIIKKLYSRNKQVILLALLFVIVVITGLIPWFIDLTGGESTLRMSFIEIHDKITLILIIFLILHFIKRYNWFSKTYEKLKINQI